MDLMSNLENASALDRLTEPGQRAARLLPPGRARDALHGVWLGHPLHPALVQVPAGTWLSASLLDAWPGNETASRRLVLAGLAAAVPAALAGATGGFLGSHIAYRQSAGANQAEPVPHLVEPGWHDLMPAAGLAERQPVKRMLGDVPVVVIRDGADIHVLADRCSHLSGPLSDGDYSGGCLTCPWHGSTFKVRDGAVARGPATAPQPVFQTRVADGTIQVCLPGAG